MSDSKIDAYKELLDERDNLKKELAKAKSSMVLSENDNSCAELNIAELELKRLQDKAFQGSLSLEDIKKYDILVKNKRLVQEKSTSNERRSEPLGVIDVTELTRLAGGHIIEEDKKQDDS